MITKLNAPFLNSNTWGWGRIKLDLQCLRVRWIWPSNACEWENLRFPMLVGWYKLNFQCLERTFWISNSYKWEEVGFPVLEGDILDIQCLWVRRSWISNARRKRFGFPILVVGKKFIFPMLRDRNILDFQCSCMGRSWISNLAGEHFGFLTLVGGKKLEFQVLVEK